MKKLILSVLVISGLAIVNSNVLAIEQNALTQVEKPNLDEKTYHLLDAEYDYKLFSHDGNLILEGKGDKVELTDLKTGAYFLHYNGKIERVIVPGVAGS